MRFHVSDSGIGDYSPKRDATRGGEGVDERIVTRALCNSSDRLSSRRATDRPSREGVGGESKPRETGRRRRRGAQSIITTRGLFASRGLHRRKHPRPPRFSSIARARRQGKYAPGNTSISGNIMARFTNNYTGDVGPCLLDTGRRLPSSPVSSSSVYTHAAHPSRYLLLYIVYKNLSYPRYLSIFNTG